MGNSVAIFEALNKMYTTMVMGQCKFEAYMSFNETRYHALCEKVDYFADKTVGFDSTLQSLKTEIANVRHNKAECSQISALHSEIEELKDSNLSLRSAIENLECEPAISFRNHDQRISNNNLDIKRANKSNEGLAERVNPLDIKSNHFTLYIDGIPESKDSSTSQVLINRLETDAKVSLTESDFVSIFRVGKPRKAKSYPDKSK